jgi:hypothetical protein
MRLKGDVSTFVCGSLKQANKLHLKHDPGLATMFLISNRIKIFQHNIL